MPRTQFRSSASLSDIPEWLIQLSIVLLATALAFFALMAYLNFSLATFLAIHLSISIPLLCLGTLAALLVILLIQQLFLVTRSHFLWQKVSVDNEAVWEARFQEMLSHKTMAQIEAEATDEVFEPFLNLSKIPGRFETLLEQWYAEEKRLWNLYQANKQDNPEQAMQYKHAAQDCWRKLHAAFLKMPSAFPPHLLAKLKQQLAANGVPIREKYSPEQYIDHLFSPPRPTVFLPVAEEKTKSHAIPAHLKHWVQEISLTHQQEQHHVQQHNFEQEQEQDVKVDLGLSTEQEMLLLVDHSSVSLANYVSEQGLLLGSHWFLPLVQAVFDESDRLGLLSFKIAGLDYKRWKELFSISEQAQTAMLGSVNIVRVNDEKSFNLYDLPQGFFIELRPDKSGFIFKFDPEWSAKIKHKAHRALLIKPTKMVLQKGRPKNPKYLSLLKPKQKTTQAFGVTMDEYEEIKESDWLTLLDTKKTEEIETCFNSDRSKYWRLKDEIKAAWYAKLGLNEQQKDFLNSASNMLPMSVLVQIYHQSTPEDTRRFIEFMRRLAQRKSSEDSESFGDPLHIVFVRPYWKENLACNWTLHLPALELITGFSDEEFSWFEALTESSADIEEVVHGLVYFFQFFKDKGLTLPPPSIFAALKKHSHYSGMPSVKFNQLKAILDCISLAQDQKLQVQWMSQLPGDFTYANSQLRGGYLAIHKAMCFEDNGNYLQKAFNKRFPQLLDPFWITPQELKAIDYEELKQPEPPKKGWDDYYSKTPEQENYQLLALRNPLLYRALFLRYCAAHLNPEDFHKAIIKWEELMEEKLSNMEDPNDLHYIGKPEQAKPGDSTLAKKLAEHWPAMKAFMLGLPTKAALEKEKPEWLVQQPEIPRAYDTSDLDPLLEKMGIEAALREKLIKDMKYLNQQAFAMPSSHEEFQAEIDKAKQAVAVETKQSEEQKHKDILDQLVLMREAHFRLSKKKDAQGKIVKAGEWMRREQALAILLDYYSEHRCLHRIMTDEGKTFILQLIAMALQGKKVDIITHNEPLAEASYAALKPLARLFGIKIANKKSSDAEKASADILYIDAASAVIAHKRKQLAESHPDYKEDKMLDRKADIALVDEADNVTVDIQDKTTMQISMGIGGEADETLQAFLYVLNETVRGILSTQSQLKEKEAQRAVVVAAIEADEKAKLYYEQHCVGKTKVLDRWISASVTGMGLIEKQHYVLENGFLFIVHTDTTGRVDRISQWGKGVHQCVAAWEKRQKGGRIKIPALSRVIAEGNVIDYLRTQYSSVSGFTGTIGELEVQQQIEASLATTAPGSPMPRTFIIPPAKRAAPKDAAWTWPQVLISDLKDRKEEKIQPKTETQYKRFYASPPQIFKDKNAYLEHLLNAMHSIQEQEYSGIIFLDTIQACEDMCQFARANGISPETLQILDDTTPDEKADADARSLRPGEATVIDQAKKPRMITFSTAAGGRGTDFDGITIGIAARPGLLRVLTQAKGRLARHSGLSIFEEIYWEGDMPGEDKSSRSIDEQGVDSFLQER